ncbi:uroporphyrinogen-III C-methyltransferase, partial [Salmonella enterica subsp. enterica serovar Montevideo]|nr:uroporphyrinogen-III C-methyltransferase [Salmonella enterica subsp. enterica serovar Montevideo]
GIILKLNQLSNQIDNLRLADNDTDGSPMDSDSSELSSSLSEWHVFCWHPALPCCSRVIYTMALWMRCKILLKLYTTFALTEIFHA